MNPELTQALQRIPETAPSLEQLPPAIRTAIGIDDTVYIMLLSMSKPQECTRVLMEYVLVRDLHQVTRFLLQVPGFIYKPFDIGVGNQIKTRLEDLGSTVVFIRPDRVVVEEGRLLLDDDDLQDPDAISRAGGR